MAKQSSKKTQRSRAAQQAAEIRREAAKKEARRRNLIVGGVVLAVLVVIVGIAYSVQSGRDTSGDTATTPAGVVDGYGVPIGKADAPVKLVVYEDFMCPICGELESMTRSFLGPAIEDGTVHVVYRPIAFLDRMSSGTKYSTRATNAFAAVFDLGGEDAARTMHDLLFENQPKEGSTGLDDDQLIDFAVQAGVDKAAVTKAIEDLEFKQWVTNATDQSSKDGVTGTPTVELNGKRFGTDTSLAEIASTIQQAIKDAK
ncbi:MAG: DsbA family protein [Nocardioidaceae bacterium]